MQARMDNPKAICPSKLFFEAGGINVLQSLNSQKNITQPTHKLARVFKFRL